MLKRLLTVWLILSVLGFGTAWAFGQHGGFQGHAEALAVADHDAHYPDDSAGGEHCCHLGFHLLGIPGDASALGRDAGHPFPRATPVRLTSLPLDPPAKPPRS